MKVVQKGYTLKVVSWENDGDIYKTKYYTVPTLEEARTLYNLCTILFKSLNNSTQGIGNSASYSKTVKDRIISYYEEHKEELSKFYTPIHNAHKFEEFLRFFSYELIGSSEDYYFRVCESCQVFYSPEDIHCEDVKFN